MTCTMDGISCCGSDQGWHGTNEPTSAPSRAQTRAPTRAPTKEAPTSSPTTKKEQELDDLTLAGLGVGGVAIFALLYFACCRKWMKGKKEEERGLRDVEMIDEKKTPRNSKR